MPPARRRAPGANPPLPPSHLISPSPQLSKILLRLSKPSLIELIRKWIKDPTCAPDLSPTDDELDFDDEADDIPLEDVVGAYESLKTRKAIVERIFDREWRNGLTLLQIAHSEVQHLIEQPSSLKWSVGELTQQGSHAQASKKEVTRFQPKTFAKSLQSLVSSMAQCHYYILRHPSLPLHLVRLALYPPHPLPSKPSQSVIYLAFPDASQHIFFTPQAGPLPEIVRQSLPIALSSQHQRYEITSVGLSARTLETLVAMKGSGRGATGAGGAWSIYKVEGDKAVEPSPLEGASGRRKRASESDTIDIIGKDDGSKDVAATEEERLRTKRQKIAEGRFGISAKESDGVGLERVQFHIRDVFPMKKEEKEAIARAQARKSKKKSREGSKDINVDDDDESDPERPWTSRNWRPNVTVTLEGSHVFAGVRSLVEEGVIDGEKMPAWMTGEDGRSIGAVKDKRLKRGTR